MKAPAPGPAQAIGRTNAGCVRGAQPLPPQGEGYTLMRHSRGRYYAHPQLIRYIEDLGRNAGQLGGHLLVGDLAQPRGGPVPGSHASHQTGLDADLWYWPASAPPAEREATPAPSLVSGNRLTAWQPYDARLLQTAAEPPEVERIFVHPAIKRRLCETHKGAPWLQKIRPWYGHADHFHVRLRCPADSPSCVPPSALPPGDGCDASLDWWFTEDTRTSLSSSPAPPALPETCAAVLAE